MLPTAIVVPLDGSALAENSLEPARALASAFDAELELVRATWHRPPDHEEHYLRDLADRFAYEKTSSTVLHGFAATAIAAFVEDIPFSLLCLSTRGHTGLVGEVLLGSVAAELIDASATPSIVVGPSSHGLRVGEGVKGTIIFCFDRSMAATRLEGTVVEWAKALHLDVKVVTVVHRNGEFLGDVPAGAVRLAGEAFVGHLASHGIAGEQVVIDCVDPARAILRLADETDTTLIAVGTTAKRDSQGLARLSRVVLGSTSERLVRHATAPVLIAQP